LTYYFRKLPAGMDIDTYSGLIRWIPGEVLSEYVDFPPQSTNIHQVPWELKPFGTDETIVQFEVEITDTNGGDRMLLEFNVNVAIDRAYYETDLSDVSEDL